MKIYDLEGKETGKIEVPSQFNEPYHPDLIKRAVLTIQSVKRQPYGAAFKAGQNYSARISKRRKDYRTSYGHGISRAARKVMWRRGRQFGWVGAVTPGTTGGRKAHPPKPQKIWAKKINKVEELKAIRSALGATLNQELVTGRGHKIPQVFPLLIESKLESLKKTKEIKLVLEKLGLQKELTRASEKKVRAGKGKARGRKYKKKKGILIVVSNICNLQKAAKSIPGTDIVEVSKLNAELLAPGSVAGRLTLYTDKALERMKKEKLYLKK